MNTRKLNTGADIPAIGFGTWEIKPDAAAEQAVSEALEAGYRHIDTAKIYSNEPGVGRAIHASGIDRKDLFVTTKLWNDDQGSENAIAACQASLHELGLEYLDLYLIHWPATQKRHGTWRCFEQLHDEGLIKAAGVSNYTIEHLQELLDRSSLIPAVNQVEFHPFIYEQQRPLLDFCKQHGIAIEAYSPLSRISSDVHSVIEGIAQDTGKSPQQVVLRWCLQHETIPLPRSTNPEHMASNLAIFDFELSADAMTQLDSLSDGQRVTWDPAGMGKSHSE